jgi:hypothetical protein
MWLHVALHNLSNDRSGYGLAPWYPRVDPCPTLPVSLLWIHITQRLLVLLTYPYELYHYDYHDLCPNTMCMPFVTAWGLARVIREVVQKPCEPHAAFLRCEKPHAELCGFCFSMYDICKPCILCLECRWC